MPTDPSVTYEDCNEFVRALDLMHAAHVGVVNLIRKRLREEPTAVEHSTSAKTVHLHPKQCGASDTITASNCDPRIMQLFECDRNATDWKMFPDEIERVVQQSAYSHDLTKIGVCRVLCQLGLLRKHKKRKPFVGIRPRESGVCNAHHATVARASVQQPPPCNERSSVWAPPSAVIPDALAPAVVPTVVASTAMGPTLTVAAAMTDTVTRRNSATRTRRDTPQTETTPHGSVVLSPVTHSGEEVRFLAYLLDALGAPVTLETLLEVMLAGDAHLKCDAILRIGDQNVAIEWDDGRWHEIAAVDEAKTIQKLAAYPDLCMLRIRVGKAPPFEMSHPRCAVIHVPTPHTGRALVAAAEALTALVPSARFEAVHSHTRPECDEVAEDLRRRKLEALLNKLRK